MVADGSLSYDTDCFFFVCLVSVEVKENQLEKKTKNNKKKLQNPFYLQLMYLSQIYQVLLEHCIFVTIKCLIGSSRILHV